MHFVTSQDMLDILISIELTRKEFLAATDSIIRLEAHDRLMTLYSCLPVSALIEYVSEAGRKYKGAA
jgi:hypothetical protein